VFSYLDVAFPTLDAPLFRAYEFTHSHARYEHELAKIYFLDWGAQYDSIAAGTPVTVTLTGNTSARTINGYVHHITPDLAQNKSYVEITVIGASYMLKQQSQKIWVDTTAEAVVADIANKNGMSYIAPPYPRIFDQISQAGMSDWELLVKLAKQCGYSFKADNTTLIFQPLTQDFTDLREQAQYFALTGLESAATDIFSFNPLIGEAIPYTDAQKATTAVSGVDRSSGVDHVNTNQSQIKTTRAKGNAPVFDSYNTSVVAPSFQVAKYESDAADERNRYAYRGEVVVQGNPGVIPDSPVFLDGIGKAYSGFWTVLSVEHSISEHSYTTTLNVGTDSLGLSAQWTDNKTISAPDEKIKRVIKPGVRQINIAPKTSLVKTGKTVKKGNSSHASQVKNQSKTTTTSAPSYKWSGTLGNLKQAAVPEKKMPPAVLSKMGLKSVR
jgi:phage protein D